MRTFVRLMLSKILGWDYINSQGYLTPAKNRIRQYENNMFVGERVLEIGPGSGVISKMALEKGATEVIAVDINPAAVEATKKLVPEAIVLEGNLFDKVNGVFDTIILHPLGLREFQRFLVYMQFMIMELLVDFLMMLEIIYQRMVVSGSNTLMHTKKILKGSTILLKDMDIR
ncbi:50S ribosomal protein L11 methyltransferase [Candidatus Micrarchaeota archaeon]|nr:50S ribosomal protein L11 methyltransferase [Candidatus Micrarchaeota archaeon]